MRKGYIWGLAVVVVLGGLLAVEECSDTRKAKGTAPQRREMPVPESVRQNEIPYDPGFSPYPGRVEPTDASYGPPRPAQPLPGPHVPEPPPESPVPSPQPP